MGQRRLALLVGLSKEAPVTEDHGTYDDADDASDGVERIGDILRRLIDERGWPMALGHTRANGAGSGGDAWCPDA